MYFGILNFHIFYILLAPALTAVEYQTNVFNGSYRYISEYRGPPSRDVDMAWRQVTKSIPPIRVSEEELSKIGIPVTRSSVKFQDEDGGGYMAALEVNHQLHCLDMLRKYTYIEHYKPFDEMFQGDPEELRVHTDHCVEMLRQRLMCTSDIGVIAYDWVQGRLPPHPNFSTRHTCRNFDKILAWNYQNAVHIQESRVVRFGDSQDLPELP
ncbi:hypothetical protein BDQ17DRAFT_1469115 [Cyathus striatus]|nr:hypothetical protein BDQ17DRAFT_1469115 [Cyathus striatus]